jgi:hypothetical protein
MITRHVLLISFLALTVSPVAFGQTVEQKSSLKDFYAKLDDQDKQALYKIMLADPMLPRKKPEKKRVVQAAIPSKAPPIGSGSNQPPPATTALPCTKQSFYLRRDRTDVFGFLIPCGPSDVPGASISYTEDRMALTQNLTVQSLAGYTLGRGGNSDGTFQYSLTPSIFVNGVLTEPMKATERNAIRSAFDSEFLISTPALLFREQTIDVAPYYQTDFRGRARIDGIDAVWEPYNLDILLGGRNDEQARRLLGFYWRLQGEVDTNRVDNAGLTNFVSATDHAFLGGTLQARMILFQNMPQVGEGLCGRIYLSATGQRFTDVEAGRSVSNYSAEVGYYLGSGVSPYWRFCVPRKDGEAPLPSASATSSSVSLVYNNGTDKTTMVNQRQYKVQLSIRY